jgi:hypothetical protein
VSSKTKSKLIKALYHKFPRNSIRKEFNLTNAQFDKFVKENGAQITLRGLREKGIRK